MRLQPGAFPKKTTLLSVTSTEKDTDEEGGKLLVGTRLSSPQLIFLGLAMSICTQRRWPAKALQRLA